MGSKLARFLLFLSSYFPLFLIFFVLFMDENPWLASWTLILGFMGLIGMAAYLRVVNRLEPDIVEVEGVRTRGAEAIGYIVGYLMPFLSIPFTGFQQAAALAIFLAALCIVYVNSNMIYLNPMLNLVGYRLYEVTLENGGEHFLITRHRVVRGDSLSVVKTGEDILMEKTK